MTKGREQEIVEKCRRQLQRARQHSAAGLAGGVSVDLYQFKATAGNDAKLGKFFQPTHMGRFAHDADNGITLKGDCKGSECKFWIHDLNNQGKLQETIRRSLRLKHYAILKPILCNESEELSKCIAACAVYQETFVEWRRTQQVKSSGDYLSDEEKSMIISLWDAIEEIWKKGYTSDAIALPSSYVMVSKRIKILPFIIRDQRDGDNKMTLRSHLADFLRVNISPLWNNAEFNEFVDLIEDPNASYKFILGHPVLLSPVERQAMYRQMCSTSLTEDQKALLNTKVTGHFDWNVIAKSDRILGSIIQKNQFCFSLDGCGACHLGRVVSCHYTEHMRAVDQLWYEQLKEDTVDKCLKTNLPLVLCRRYALTCDPSFHQKK